MDEDLQENHRVVYSISDPDEGGMGKNKNVDEQVSGKKSLEP